MQSPFPHPTLIDLLRATMRQIEVTLATRPDEPAMLALKRQIAASIAELEVVKSVESPIDAQTKDSELSTA